MATIDISNTQKRSISLIMHNKLLDTLENATFKQIIRTVELTTLSVGLTFILTNTQDTIHAIEYVSKAYNFLLPKAIFSFALVFNYKKLLVGFRQQIQGYEQTDTIEGIPTVELLDHLFEYGSFKREDVEKKFGIPRNRFTELAKKLEDLEILTRGENNARVLNDDFSRSDIANILDGKTTAKELKKVYRNIDNSTYSAKPTKKTIADRVENYLNEDVAPQQFAIRKIPITR